MTPLHMTERQCGISGIATPFMIIEDQSVGTQARNLFAELVLRWAHHKLDEPRSGE